MLVHQPKPIENPSEVFRIHPTTNSSSSSSTSDQDQDSGFQEDSSSSSNSEGEETIRMEAATSAPTMVESPFINEMSSKIKLLTGDSCMTRSSLYQKHLKSSSSSARVPHFRRIHPAKKLDTAKVGGAVDPGWTTLVCVYFCYGVLIMFGYIRMGLESMGVISQGMLKEKNREGYPHIYKSWQPFFGEYIYRRVSDIFGQPIAGNPGGTVRVLERVSTDNNRTFHMTGTAYDCINLASYDYLGFSCQTDTPTIEASIREYGVGVASMGELGRLPIHDEVEQMLAKFVGKESCIVFGMGFATNASNIPALVTDCPDTLILGDHYSHTSVRLGLFLSRASFKFFKHNDFTDLERQIRLAITRGNPRTSRPYRKIIILVEGVYSMEGTIVDLPKLVELKKRYKCYLYIDEAHSIGAVGPHGRGVCDYFGVDPADVDLLMGTMTKSFAAAGGYIAGSREAIAHIRANSASNYAGAMAAPVAQQIINTLRILMVDPETGRDAEGQKQIRQLLDNTHFMREELEKMGFIIYGHRDSPVIPIMVYFPSKVGSMVRMGIRKGLALVAAGYPATTLPTCRIRLCMSASHSRETLKKALAILSEMGDLHQAKYAKKK